MGLFKKKESNKDAKIKAEVIPLAPHIEDGMAELDKLAEGFVGDTRASIVTAMKTAVNSFKERAVFDVETKLIEAIKNVLQEETEE